MPRVHTPATSNPGMRVYASACDIPMFPSPTTSTRFLDMFDALTKMGLGLGAWGLGFWGASEFLERELAGHDDIACGQSAIHWQDDAGDGRCGVGRQERDRAHHLDWL